MPHRDTLPDTWLPVPENFVKLDELLPSTPELAKNSEPSARVQNASVTGDVAEEYDNEWWEEGQDTGTEQEDQEAGLWDEDQEAGMGQEDQEVGVWDEDQDSETGQEDQEANFWDED
ncbi:MAG: hypothetical protein NC930_02375 [Candidatus Omnitrophica bacterium]|nr:hypothetical protein [Candidatus Omnitrophota bacterium]